MKVPLRIGDVWVLIGPGTHVTITELQPRPTSNKPHAQAVTLDDGRTIAEATLRGSYKRLPEYRAFCIDLGHRLREAFADYFEPRKTGQVIQFPGARKP